MKKERKYIIGTVCLIILAAFVCGCGKEQEAPDSKPAGVTSGDLPKGYVFLPRFEDAGRETNTMRGACLIDSSLYYFVNVYDEEQGGLVYDVYVQEKGEEPRRLLDFGYGDEKSLRALASGEDGSLYALYREGAEEDESQSYTLEKRNKELQIIYSVDTTEGMEGIPGIYDMEAGADGVLYGVTLKGTVVYWDAAGRYQGKFTLPKDAATAKGLGVMNAPQTLCFGLVNAGLSGVYAYWASEEEETGSSVWLCNLKEWEEMGEGARETAEPLQVDLHSAEPPVVPGDDDTFFVFSGYGDGLYMADRDRLWRISLKDGSLEPLLSWEEIGLKPWYVREIRKQADGGFLMHVLDTLEKENYWVALDPVPESELPEKRELVLGVAKPRRASQSLTSKIDQVVLSYNRTHPFCHVTIKEYEESNITNFQMELLTGGGPDVLLELESFFDMETLLGKGIVEDLSPWLAGSEEEILPGILELAMRDGKVPRIPLSFSAEVTILSEGMGQKIMTPQEMAEFMTDSAYRDYVIYPKYLLCDILFGAEMDRYVDKETKSCSFDSEEFVGLLESLAKLDDMEMISGRGKRAELFRSGKLSTVVEEMDCLEDYLLIRDIFSEAGEISGFPNSDRELRYPAKLYDWMGINSATEYKEEAWSLIEFCLSYMSRSDNVKDRFVVTKDKFYRQTRLEKKVSYSVLPFLSDDENWSGQKTIEFLPQEESDWLWEISEHLYYYEDNDLLNVIQEEAEAFFVGDISAEEAALRIQNRASLIVGE